MVMGGSPVAVIVEVKVGGFAFGIIPAQDQPPLAIYSDGMITNFLSRKLPIIQLSLSGAGYCMLCGPVINDDDVVSARFYRA
tara:strand:+ start:6573 stop:6818 length:246 start_codon:yes stop_codon:yes gene_type:complete